MSVWSGLRPRRSCCCWALRHAAIIVQSEPLVCLSPRFCMLRIRLDAVRGILFAINWSDMRRVSIEIWSSDSELFFVRIDPFPHLLGGSQSLCTGLALYA